MENFNAFEILRIAQKIEQDGSAFYQQAATIVTHKETRTLLLNLAKWEENHKALFMKMADNIDPDKWQFKYDPAQYKAVAALNTFAIQASAPADLSENTSRLEILKIALKKETDTITFYKGLKNFTTDPSAIETIDMIIKEEQHHVTVLNQAMEGL